MLKIPINISTGLCLAVLMLCTCPAFAQRETKEAILLVAFGSSHQSALISYTNVEKQVKSAFPEYEIHWAWTAHSLLQPHPESPRLSVQEALAKLATQGVKKVYILSLHILPGLEYSHLVQTARAFEGLPKGIQTIRLSQPLLFDTQSVDHAAQMLLANAPQERNPQDALIFVGHGTHHAAGVYYPALQYYLHTHDPLAFMGALAGSPALDTILSALQIRGVRTVWLAPFMTVAGDHAVHDIFGPHKESWKSTIEAQGIRVKTLRQGLGEYPAFIEQWVQNLRSIMQ